MKFRSALVLEWPASTLDTDTGEAEDTITIMKECREIRSRGKQRMMICGFVWTKSGESQTQTWSDTLRPESGDTVCREADEWWRHVECSHNTTALATITVVNSSALVQAHAHAVPAQCWDHGFWEVSKCFYFRAVQRGFSKTKLTFNLISWLGLPGLRNLFFFQQKLAKLLTLSINCLPYFSEAVVGPYKPWYP